MTSNNQELQIKERLEYALLASFEAEKVILSYYQDPKLVTETKRDKSVVTAADKESETKIRSLIERVFPEDSIVGEEHEAKPGTSEFTWIIDPIDGTQSFVCGVPLFGTMIGITRQGRPVAGVVHMPVLKETYYASAGQGAWWRPPGHIAPIRAHVSQTQRLEESLFCTTSHAGFERAGRRDLLDQLLAKTKKFRGWGSCYGHMLVATGRADLMVEPHISIWDCAALMPIITEAGGRFFDLKGEARIDGGSGISSNANLYEPMRALLLNAEGTPAE